MMGLATATATMQRREPRPDVIQWPDSRFPTIQQAIDTLPDGGTLRFVDGVFTLDEPLFVRGKRIVIEGTGCDELPNPKKRRLPGGTHLVGPRVDRVVDFTAARGLLNFESAGPGTIVGGGTIRNLKLSGFDAGIRAAAADDTAPGGGAVVEHVCIADSGRGIAWSAVASLSVKTVLIRDVAWNGASIVVTTALAGAFIHFADVTIVNAANACGRRCRRTLQLLWIERDDCCLEFEPVHRRYEHHWFSRSGYCDVRRECVHQRDVRQ